MANQWFKFRQFIIKQDLCAMKVGTDGVILGAWTNVTDSKRALDIGTGTGLLALMLAQRSDFLTIDAIELDPGAARQAEENVAGSGFNERITVRHADFRTFNPGHGISYDLVICNPPYFSGSKLPGSRERGMARHSDTLTTEDIFTGSSRLLDKKCRLSIIVPAENAGIIIKEAQKAGLYPIRQLLIHPFPGVYPKRICIEFSREVQEPVTETITIEQGPRHAWTDEYRKLTCDFYLAF